MDLSARRAYNGEKDLKPKEFALLEIPARHRDRLFTAEELCEKRRGLNALEDVRTV